MGSNPGPVDVIGAYVQLRVGELDGGGQEEIGAHVDDMRGIRESLGVPTDPDARQTLLRLTYPTGPPRYVLVEVSEIIPENDEAERELYTTPGDPVPTGSTERLG